MCYSVFYTNTKVHHRRTKRIQYYNINCREKEGAAPLEDFITQNEKNMILVDSKVLPETYIKVLEAKRLIESGEMRSASEACSAVGISRSAFYKYKDHIYDYNDSSGRIVTVYAVLLDRAGILSKLMSVLYESGANIMTVNQNIPSGGRAAVSVSFRTGQLKMSVGELLIKLKELDGVRNIQQVSGQ